MNANRRPARSILCALGLAALVLGGGAAQGVEITLVSTDGPDEGFNDPTPVATVTGNSGRTLGKQRRNVFEAVAWKMGNLITSAAEIRIQAGWAALDCGPLSGTLATAGPTFVFRDFPKAPKPQTWYASALANALEGEDLNGRPSMRISFNADVGTTGCLDIRGWDYRIGVAGTAGFSMEEVLFHEMAHGLGFTTFVDGETGARFQDFDDPYMLNLEDHATGRRWGSMSDSERQASAIRTGELLWAGGNAALAALRLRLGVHPENGRPQMYAPDPYEPGSSVSHWDPSLTRNVDDFMEPQLPATVADLVSLPLLQDLGWGVNRSGVGWIEDLNGNGTVELAVLRVRDDPAGHAVVVIDSRSKKVIREIALPANLSALDLAVIPSFDGSPASEIAVLISEVRRSKIRVLVFDAGTGDELRRVSYPTGYPVRLQAVPDYRGTSAWELAVAGTRRNTGTKLWIKDAKSGASLRSLSFPRQQLPVDFDVVRDVGGTSAPDLAAALAIPLRGFGQIKIRDGRSGEVVTLIDLPENLVPQFLRAVRDFDGEVGDEVALLSLDRESGGADLRVYDAISGQPLRVMQFGEAFVPAALGVLPNFGGTGADELMVWSRRAGNLKPRGYILDADSLAVLAEPSLNSKHVPRAFAVLPNVGATGAPDMAIISALHRDQRTKAILVDGRGREIRNMRVP